MKVLHADSGREMRGGQWQVLQLHAGLGDDSMLLCREGSPLMAECRRRGLRVEALSIASLAAWARKVQITHAHDARSHTWAAAVGGSPLVVSRRVAFPIGQSWMSRWKYARAGHFIAVSEYVRGVLCDGGVAASRISVVHDGVDIPPAVAVGELIVAVATVDPMKGSALLQEAAASAGITVTFSSDLLNDLQRAALLVYITYSEGLGSAALLAMAAGVPVVASNVGGLPEIVQSDVTGVLTENDVPSIAAAIRHALSQREILSRNARNIAQQRFSNKVMITKTVRVYESVLGC